ncbi:hypothetical protein MRX96_002896 [Rhipicephalus microplus]
MRTRSALQTLWLRRDVSFEKSHTPSQAEATAIENLSRTSPRAVPSQDTKSAADSSPEATSWNNFREFCCGIDAQP